MRGLLPCLFILGLPASADPITLVPYETLEPRLVSRIDFEDFPRQMSPGLSLDGVVDFEGASMGERFSGHVLTERDGFDRLSHLPLPPLRLEPGAEGQNLAVSFLYMMSNQLGGLGPAGFPSRDAGGEGSIAVLFDRDQFALGFKVAAEPTPEVAAPKGRMNVAFFRRDATFISVLTIGLDWGFSSYGFVRENDAEDIAGMVITNLDPEGIAIDDLIFDTSLVLGWLESAD